MGSSPCHQILSALSIANITKENVNRQIDFSGLEYEFTSIKLAAKYEEMINKRLNFLKMDVGWF
ncbi:hypothetical protein FPV32_04800 [Bacillus tequilensis]|nr:hypothetical protein [Bacillus tequilensis]